MRLGTLDFKAALNNFNLVAEPVRKAIEEDELTDIYVSEIDSNLADTLAFCEHYKIGLDISANCVVVEAKRADKVWYAACVVLATTKIDVNGMVRRYLNARQISFASMDKAVTMTKMEYGGITPIGLPASWPILIDRSVVNTKNVIIGSGLRKSKLLVPSQLLAALPSAITLDIIKTN